ncbi:hypothetical protein K491DRAFT_590199 [Lophiostoma macrostomum CBS 122681]|uniref:D-lactate dehydrogenase (cytochrome) n=1 Tax=Lophiostoma macrostomum CBS 122681 TaxID=1314788 RepID=A0A6A6TL19_9PLEO|nr:hypothetical protein K491DRAFT_590199 [Lophiostoma macrostomum CBS 122681]
MHRKSRSDAGELSSPRSSRAASFSSDRPSVAGAVTFQMPSSVRPAPAYIAASVASQIVTDHHNAQLRDDHDAGSDGDADQLENAIFSEQALWLLNAFLDHLLFAFLSTARSPSLTAIRPAITDVLKPRLAREAMVTADDELQGLLGGEEDEEFPAQDGKAAERWDVEKVWKRTRLRIMVYTRLGELEDEDEERYVQQERGLSMDDDEDDEAGLVSWASAIFLTSIIEYIAEQTLLVSGQASFARISAKAKKAAQAPEDGEDQQVERIVIEDFDVEKIALNSALGRLWRTWRKRVRSPTIPLTPSRGPRSTSSFTSLHRRRISHDTIDDSLLSAEGVVPEMPEHKPTETEIAANIPLPLGDNDVKEIEVPGIAHSFEDDESSGTETPVTRPQRPSSVIMLAPAENFRRRLAQERPLSMPPPGVQPLVVPTQAEAGEAAEAEEMPFVTPMERTSDDESYIMDERQEGMQHEDEMDEADDDADMVAFAASTGMGFGMGPESPVKAPVSGKETGDTMHTPTQAAYAAPRVLQSKRMSIEKTGPPGIVRTYSSRGSRSPSLQAPEARSYLDDSHTDDDLSGPEAIGVARTSNMPIPSPSPSAESPLNEKSKQKHPDHQGYVELAPRHVGTLSAGSIAALSSGETAGATRRKTPSPDMKTVAQKPTQRAVASHEQTTPSEKSAQRTDATPPRSRVPVLSSLRESESPTSSSQEPVPVKKQIQQAQRGSGSSGSPKHSGSTRSRESPVPVPERSAKRKSTEGSPRTRIVAADGFPVEKSTLQRVSSTSSTTKSVSTSILHPGPRDSDVSLGRSRGLSGRMSEEDRVREFDSLVQRDETVKFTLTPQAMRDMDAEPSPPTASVTVYPRVNADKDNQFGSQPMPSRSASRSKASANSPGRSTGRKSVGPKPLAREPRIQAESMRDFADFIRSTGPSAGEQRPVQPFVSLANSDPKSPNGSSTTIGGLGRKLSLKQGPTHSHSNSTLGEGPSARPRVHMEPRSPAGQRSGNDDLIDFIRQGPPGANNGQPRIPRSVAPFRTTVDSDQFERMLDDNGNIESAYGSQVSTNSKQSAQTTNSRTGLLPAANVVQPAYSNTPQKLTGSLSSPEPHIQRTRRRIKDPYAIDLSDDEDDDLLTALPKSSKRQEESLMDFLNSMEPPSSQAPQPLHLSEATVAAAKARAANNLSNSSLPSSSSSTTATRNGASSRATRNASAQPALISSNITSDAPRAHKPKLQARAAGAQDGRVGRSTTNDLADFLRTSGPPEPAAPPPVIRASGVKRPTPTCLDSFLGVCSPFPNIFVVVYPKTTADVSVIVKACHARNIAVISFGGGTSLGGALSATRQGICIDFKHMDNIVQLHEDDMDVVVQPNVGWVELNEYLEPKGLFFPPDPAKGARIGGMIAMSCSGTNAYRYGTMQEWVISLTVVLADGTVVKTRNRPRKSSAGYDLTHLIIGSEGTLALVTEAVLKITALPQNLHVGMASFESMQQGVDVAVRILKSGHLLEAIELADKASMEAINHSGLAQEKFAESPTLFFKIAGSLPTVDEQARFIKEVCSGNGPSQSFEVSNNKERVDVIWGARKALGNALVTMKKTDSDLFLHTDAAVPISKMAELVDRSEQIVSGSGWFLANVGHVGDGNVHTAIVCPEEDKEAAEKLLEKVQRLALELDGTITGEHGVGLKLRDLLTEEVGQAGVDMMRKVKLALDPKGILNPDKVVRLEAH